MILISPEVAVNNLSLEMFVKDNWDVGKREGSPEKGSLPKSTELSIRAYLTLSEIELE
jgi:hypothetical protein